MRYSSDNKISYTIPKTVTEINEYAFKENKYLELIVLPQKITEIKKGTFYNCSKLSSVIIPLSVLTIEEQAFMNCQSLQFIIIERNVRYIGDDAFNGCTSLNRVIFSGIKDIDCSSEAFDSTFEEKEIQVEEEYESESFCNKTISSGIKKCGDECYCFIDTDKITHIFTISTISLT